MVLVLIKHFQTRRLELASYHGLPIQFESRDQAFSYLRSFVVDFIETEFQMWGITCEEWQELQERHR